MTVFKKSYARVVQVPDVLLGLLDDRFREKWPVLLRS